MGEFVLIEKEVEVFDKALLEKLLELGVEICAETGNIHAHIWVPKEHSVEVFDLLRKNGFKIGVPYEKRKSPPPHS